MDKQVIRYKFGNSPAVEEKKNRKKFAYFLMATFIFISLFSAFYFTLSSSYFKLEEIVFDGNKVLSYEELEGVFPYVFESNIWQVDLSLVEEKYESLPRIKEAKARRELPNSVALDLIERETLALLPYQEYYFEVPADGILMNAQGETENNDYPLITEMTGVLYRPGENISHYPGGGLLLTFLEVNSKGEVEVSEINMSNPENLVIITMNGRKVWLGRGDYEKKLEILPEILASWHEPQGYLDFRVLNAPAVVY